MRIVFAVLTIILTMTVYLVSAAPVSAANAVTPGEFIIELISDSWEYETPHMFAGSLFDLKPDTDYECRFVMSDPDGLRGKRGAPRTPA